MYITVDDIKNEISFYYPVDNRNGNKKVGLIRTYFNYSFYNVENDEKIHLKNAETLKVKRSCYSMKDIERVFSGKVKYDSLTCESVIDSSIRRFGPHMNIILGINNENYIDMLLFKKYFHSKLLNCKPQITYIMASQMTYCILGTLIKTSFGDMIYFGPKNIQYKKLVNGVIDRLKVSLIISNIREIHYYMENKTNGGKQIQFSAESSQFEKKTKVGINEMFSNC